MTRPLHIVVADDDPAVRECVSLMLAELGHIVTPAEDGRELLDRCRADGPDLVISDVRMPEPDGLAAAAVIRREWAIPVLLMSAGWTAEQQATAAAVGAAVLHKPIHPLAVAAAVETARRAAGPGHPRPPRCGDTEDELFRQLVETVEDYAIFTLDTAGRVTHWNRGAERLFGYCPGQVYGQGWDRLFPPEDAAAGRPADELRAAATAGRLEEEGWHRRADGTRFWGSGVLTAVRGADGRVLGFGKIVRDRSSAQADGDRLRGRVADLQAVDETRTAFLAELAHELRHPLAPLLYSAEVLRGRADLPADVRAIGGRIAWQARQMGRLVDDLLDAARVRQGRVRLDRRRVDLATVVGQEVDAVRPRAEAAGHTLTLVRPDAPVWVDGDAVRLAQVAANLLHNAVRFTPPGGRIGVRVEAWEAAACVRVKDTGVGIPADRLTAVFDLFDHDARSLPAAQDGLGIGLALVRELVVLHGGTVTAHSGGDGRGSEFVVWLRAEGESVPGGSHL